MSDFPQFGKIIYGVIVSGMLLLAGAILLLGITIK